MKSTPFFELMEWNADAARGPAAITNQKKEFQRGFSLPFVCCLARSALSSSFLSI